MKFTLVVRWAQIKIVINAHEVRVVEVTLCIFFHYVLQRELSHFYFLTRKKLFPPSCFLFLSMTLIFNMLYVSPSRLLCPTTSVFLCKITMMYRELLLHFEYSAFFVFLNFRDIHKVYESLATRSNRAHLSLAFLCFHSPWL